MRWQRNHHTCHKVCSNSALVYRDYVCVCVCVAGPNVCRSTEQQKGMGMVPKRAVNVMSCQIARFLQLTQSSIVPIGYHVQRKVCVTPLSFPPTLFPSPFSLTFPPLFFPLPLPLPLPQSLNSLCLIPPSPLVISTVICSQTRQEESQHSQLINGARETTERLTQLYINWWREIFVRHKY